MKTLLYIVLTFFSVFLLHSCREDLVGKTQTGTLTGKVVKKGTNEPIANVKIYTSPTTQTLFSGTDGTFTIPNVPVGDYSIKAELSGYLSSFQGVSLKNQDQSVSVIFEMADDNSLNSPPSVPQLLSPIDNAIDQPLSVNLTWKCTDADVKDTLKFQLIVKNDFDTNVISIKNIKVQNYNLQNLKFGVNYYWQIVVSDGINPDVYSAISHFKTSTTPNNRFHYVKKSNGNYYIVSSNDDGSNAFNFTLDTYNSFRPRLNNNSGLIAFLRTVGGNSQIFTANKDGSNVFQVTTIPIAGFNNSELDFSWSTNGKEFLYANFNKLYRINKDGSGISLVYATSDGSFISECDWSYDGSKIALKTNDSNGYNVKIFVIDFLGNILNPVFSGANGAASGLHFSIDGNKLLYCYDVSGHQDSDYRRLDSRIFMYDLVANTTTDISSISKKPNGTNDLDARFSPNNAEILLMNTSNDGISQKNIQKISLDNSSSGSYPRQTIFNDAEMPDWK